MEGNFNVQQITCMPPSLHVGAPKACALHKPSRHCHIPMVTAQSPEQKLGVGVTHDQGSPVGRQGRRPFWPAAVRLSEREDLLASNTALQYSERVPISLVLAQDDKAAFTVHQHSYVAAGRRWLSRIAGIAEEIWRSSHCLSWCMTTLDHCTLNLGRFSCV